MLDAGAVVRLAAQHRETPRGPWHVATGLVDSLADSLSVPLAIRATLALGDPAHAAVLLARYGDHLEAALRLELAGAVAAASQRWVPAAHAFGAAAVMRTDRARGMLEARAGALSQEAGQSDSAAAAYARARTRLPAIAGWLSLRQAELTANAALAESLLVAVPPAGWSLALRARARLRLLEGDPRGAETLLEAAGRSGHAAELALARGDTGEAMRLGVGAMSATDTGEVRRALVLFQETLDPPTAPTALAVARGAARMSATRQAATWGLQAITLGDSTPETLLAVGGWLESSGQGRAALEPYALAGDAGRVPHARARLRLGDRAAIATLRRFATDNPDDPAAPGALFAAADASGSDSLLRAVARQWPRHAVASNARMRLALRRLNAGDSVAAAPILEDEVTYRGAAADRARYLGARIRETRGDRDGARTEFLALAAADSLGYYGVLAREAAGLPDPTVGPPAPRTRDARATAWLEEFGLLEALGFSREAEVMLASLLERGWDDPHALLDVADGLVGLGRANYAIRLGYAATKDLTLHDARVLRAVFPWPNRDLVEAEALAFGLDPFLVAGLIRQESWFLSTARSRAGAIGYMQLMPATAKEVARRGRVPWAEPMLTMADANLHLGCAHLAGLIRSYGGEVVPALAAYNAGGTPVRRWLRQKGATDPAGFVERITYPETQAYVRAVMRNTALYRWLYGSPLASGGS